MGSANKLNLMYLASTNTAEAGNRVLLSWIDWFLDNGNNIIACCPSGGTLSNELFKRLGKRYISLEFKTSSRNILTNIASLFLLCLRFRTNIIHCNAEIAYFSARYVARLLRIPIIVHIHFHFNKAFYEWLFKKKYIPQKVLFVSNALLEEEKLKLPDYISHDQLNVLHNCLKSYNSIYLKTYGRNEYWNIGCYGPIQRRKNQEKLIYLANKFKNSNIPAKIWVAGRIRENEYKSKLNALQKKYRVDDYISFLGHVKDVFTHLCNMNCTISVSKYETFGMSVLESMSCARPVIAFDLPAIKEVLGDSGIIVPQDDIYTLYEATKVLMHSETYYRKLQKKAWERFIENFIPEKICPILEGYYLETLTKYKN